MWEIWKFTVGSSQNLDKVFAMEEGQVKKFLGEKTVSTQVGMQTVCDCIIYNSYVTLKHGVWN